VLADQLRTTHRRKAELKKLRELNDHDYTSLHRLLNQQQAGLEEALQLKKTIYREMYNGCQQIARIKRAQTAQTKKIDFRSEVQLDKRLTSSQNMLMIKFRELNQLLWQLGEPLHHPTYLHAHLNGFVELQELLDIERDLQLSFAGFDLSAKAVQEEETVETYLQRRCADAAGLIKKIGGAGRVNTFLSLSESECAALAEDGYQSLIEEDQKQLESKLTPVEEKRILRDKLQEIQTHFEACARSFAKLNNGEPRPKNYDEVLSEASALSYAEMSDLLKPLIPLSLEGRPEHEVQLLTDQFAVDYAINPHGFLQVFQEKYDRLIQLRLRMDRVEELQERELRNEETKVSRQLIMQDKISAELRTDAKSRRYLNLYNRIAEARDLYAVAFVKRPVAQCNEPFSYDDQFFCSGCNVVISKGLHQRTRRLEEVQICDSCNRILSPFAHITYVKEEVDPLLVSEEERIEMEERGELGMIPACSNCGGELYDNKEAKTEIEPSEALTTTCQSCFSFIVPIAVQEEEDAAESAQV
jgi:hypothetical protein